MIKFNALYQSLKKVSAEWHAGHVQWQYSWSYLKFYENGKVIYCCTPSDDFSKINEWFDFENDAFFYRGNYVIKEDSKLVITIPVEKGKLVFDGCIDCNNLILRMTSSDSSFIEYWDEYLLIV